MCHVRLSEGSSHGFSPCCYPIYDAPRGFFQEAEDLRAQVVECQSAGQKLQLDSEVPMKTGN